MSEWECGCPVCCALVRTVRACPFQLPFKCVCLCLSDGQSKHPWVGVVCASLSRCSALQWVTWLPCTLPHCRLYTLSYPFSCLRLQPSLCRSPVTPPPPTLSSSLIPSSAPLSAFPSPHCSHSLILEPIDLQSEWANGARVDILQCDLGACKMRGESGGKRRRGWSVREKVWKEEGLSKESKTQMMYESLSGKLGAKMHTDWPAQGFRTFSQTFLITNLTGRDQMHQRDETQLSLSGKIVIPSFIVPVTCHHRLM